jgi:tetratricopeptide (TPR) repeat protein
MAKPKSDTHTPDDETRRADLLETLRQAYSADPGDLETASKLAQLYTDKGWFNEAIEVYKTITSKDDGNYSLLLEYGNVCFKHQDFEEAAALFQKLTSLKPQRVEGWNNLGIAQLSRREEDKALESFKKVLNIEPDNAGALLNLGNCYANKNSFEEAAGFFQKAVALKPDFSDGWFNLGNTYCSMKKFPEAVGAFEKSMKYQREFPSALKNVGFAYEQMGNLDAALDNYLKALALNRGDAALYVNIANVYVVKDNFDEAKNYYLLSVKLSPKEIAGWMGLRHLALLKGDVESYAKSTLAVAGRLSPDALAESLMVLRDLGHFDKVDELLCRLDGDAVSGDEIDAERLLAYQRTDSYPGKIIALARKLKELPSPSDHVGACLARYSFDMNNFNAALRSLESLETLRIGDRKLLWQTCIALSQYDKAQRLLREYLDDHNDCFDAWFFLAKIKIMGDEPEAAREFLLKALEFGFSDMDMLDKDVELKKIFDSLKVARGEN